MKARRAGYTTIEMLFAALIVSVLVSISSIKFGAWAAKSRRAEATLAMQSLHEAQMIHYIRNGVFADSFSKLDFSIAGGKQQSATEYRGKRYTFQLSQPNGAKSWECLASGNIDSDPWFDVLIAWDERDD